MLKRKLLDGLDEYSSIETMIMDVLNDFYFK